MSDIPVIDLSKAPGERAAWDQPTWKVYLWAVCELLFVTNAWQISSGLRVRVLRAFGAEIGQGVIFRPRTRVKFPWKLHIGDRSWIGEGVWFHNQDHIHIGHDVVISQETFLTTGSHAHRRDMALITSEIRVASGAWITSRCVVLGGSDIGRSALVTPLTVVKGVIPPNSVWGNDGAVGERFTDEQRFEFNTDSTPLEGLRILRVVALASRTGLYGGPFDTARRQSVILQSAGAAARLFAGAFVGDEPTVEFLDTVPVRHLLAQKSFADVGSWAAVVKLARAVRNSDVVHVSVSREPIPVLACFFSRIYGRPLVAQPHGMLTSRSSRLHDLFDLVVTRRTLTKSSRWIALTSRESEQLESRGFARRDQIHIVGNPPPGEEEWPTRTDSSTSQPSALFAARLHPRKRVLDFADAAAIAQRNQWPERYEVLGPDEGDLPKLLELAENVQSLTYLGSTDSSGVLRRLSQSSVFVLPSRDEPWGNVLVASITLGVPVVVTSSSALAEEIHAAGAGIVVPDNDPQAIARAVHAILEGEARSSFRSAALSFGAARFSAATVLQGLLGAYEPFSESAFERAGAKP